MRFIDRVAAHLSDMSDPLQIRMHALALPATKRGRCVQVEQGRQRGRVKALPGAVLMSKMFSDEAHIDRIAAALWSREPVGTAALLVGAGFSRNAAPVRLGGGTMPGWNDIYEIMVNQLYPAGPLSSGKTVPKGPREWLLGQTGATSAYLRVAEEFEAQFGRDALDKLILQYVPDRQFLPGKLHEMLIQLPWADIMTTNWDTLLERAAEGSEERVYHVVRTVEEIPEARAPRVIKLHGSFPAHRPFVFTEEDFRTYPARAGAFVNLAQQLTMENTLVLLGFSGDDPNFLFWSGWVRDRLGPRAPLIYLVGALGLTAARRKMLEARRIQPIDLEHLPQFMEWPESQRVAIANQWFLERLRAAEPYPSRRWPRERAGFVPPLEYVEVKPDPQAPVRELSIPRESEENIGLLVAQWRQHRKVYPGWVLPPIATSELLWGRSYQHAYRVIQQIKTLSQDDRLAALYEFNWRQERALAPLVLTVDDLILDLLESLLDRYEKLEAVPASQFRALVLAIIRHAREENDSPLFEKWARWLAARLGDDPESRDRLAYERCLKLRAELDLDGLEHQLKTWLIESDSFWMLRKAGLLADLGRDEEAGDLSAQALGAIRAQTIRNGQDIASWSRESFALLFRSSALEGQLGSWAETQAVRNRFDLRQEELHARGCPGKQDFFLLIERLAQVPPPLRKKEERSRKFDLGSSNTTRHLSPVDPRLDRLLAYQALRFIEESGLPVRIGYAGVATQVLSEAARWLMDVAPTRAIDAFMRASPGATSNELDKVLTRTAVARMEVPQAERLIDRVLALINSARTRVETGAGDTRFWMERLSTALEIASRIILRAPSRAPMLLTTALDLHVVPRFARRIDLGGALQSVTIRSIESAPPEHLDSMLLRLFQHPVTPNAGPFASDVDDFAGLLSGEHAPVSHGKEWRSVVERTIEALGQADTRKAASARLLWLWSTEILATSDHRAVAQALWAPAHLEGELPGGTVLLPSAFIELPQIEGVDPRAIVALTEFDDAPLNDRRVEDGALLAAIQNDSVPLDPDMLVRQIERLRAFITSHAQRPTFDPLGDGGATLVENTTRMIAALAVRTLKMPQGIGALRRLIAEAGYPARLEPAFPPLLELGLIDEPAAIAGVQRLLTQAEFEDTHIAEALFDQIAWHPPSAVSLEAAFWKAVVQVVVSRRPVVLPSALRLLGHFMRRHPERIPAREDDGLDLGLMLLLSETNNTVPRDNLEYDPYLARFFAASLVTSMAGRGRGDPAVHAAWAEAIDTDPLPDTRRARTFALRQLAKADQVPATPPMSPERDSDEK